MADVKRILDRLDRVRRSGDGWSARCPAHDDSDPSLSVAEGRKGRVIVHCHAGCEPEDVARAVGLDLADLGPDDGAGPGYTLADYADEKLLPAAELRSWGVRTVEREKGPAIAIPYRNARGETDGVKMRAGDRFWWDPHAKLPYGLDRLADDDEGRAVLLVEGESDCHTCWHHGVLALGVPGANSWRSTWADLLDGRDVFVWKEPDEGGEEFVEAVTATLPAARVVEAPEDAEDPAELHRRDPDGFRDRLTALAEGARPGDEIEGDGVGRVRTARDILDDPDARRTPVSVADRLAWEGHVSLLAGREKSGKSTLLRWAAARRSAGQCVWGGPAPEGAMTVLYYGQERRVDVADDLDRMGADLDRVHMADVRTFDDRLSLLEHDVRELGPELVVDTLSTLTALLDLDPGSSSDWERPMERLGVLAAATDAALLVSHHARKSDGEYRDSTAIGAGVDAILEMHRVAGEGDAVREVKARARSAVPASDFKYELASGDENPRLRLVEDDLSLEERVHRFVERQEGCSQRDVIEGVRGGRDDVRDALKALCGEGGPLEEDASSTPYEYRTSDDPGGNGQGTGEERKGNEDAGDGGGSVPSTPRAPYGGGGQGTPAGPADSETNGEEDSETDEPDGGGDDPVEESAPDECVNCGSGGVDDDGLCVFCRRREEAV